MAPGDGMSDLARESYQRTASFRLLVTIRNRVAAEPFGRFPSFDVAQHAIAAAIRTHGYLGEVEQIALQQLDIIEPETWRTRHVWSRPVVARIERQLMMRRIQARQAPTCRSVSHLRRGASGASDSGASWPAKGVVASDAAAEFRAILDAALRTSNRPVSAPAEPARDVARPHTQHRQTRWAIAASLAVFLLMSIGVLAIDLMVHLNDHRESTSVPPRAAAQVPRSDTPTAPNTQPPQSISTSAMTSAGDKSSANSRR